MNFSSSKNQDRLRSDTITYNDLETLPPINRLSRTARLELRAAASVLPFKTNRYVVDELIDWSKVPDDPIYQQTFPRPEMISNSDLQLMCHLIGRNESETLVRKQARKIRHRLASRDAQLAPPATQTSGIVCNGIWHQFRETLMVFPAQAQTCFSYCNYCYRWMKHVEGGNMFSYSDVDDPIVHIRRCHEITDILFTGGDPFVMDAETLRRYVKPILKEPSIQTIRLATRAFSWCPERIVNRDDSGALLSLFEEILSRGKHLTVMAHISHPRELSTAIAERAVKSVTNTGAVIRCQAPLLRFVNDDVETLIDLWNREVTLGMIPYYMFIDADIGSRDYFRLPLAKALELYQNAYRRVSGCARTVRGPILYNNRDKILIAGIATVNRKKVFVHKYVQCVDPARVGTVFFSKYDPEAALYEQLEPVFEEDTPHFDIFK